MKEQRLREGMEIKGVSTSWKEIKKEEMRKIEIKREILTYRV